MAEAYSDPTDYSTGKLERQVTSLVARKRTFQIVRPSCRTATTVHAGNPERKFSKKITLCSAGVDRVALICGRQLAEQKMNFTRNFAARDTLALLATHHFRRQFARLWQKIAIFSGN
jgi:hypothetical protein